MATPRTFDPVGAFQGATRQRQAIEAETAAAPRRNVLADLNIEQAQQTLGATGAATSRAATQFDQQQAIQRATILNQSAKALGGIGLERRDAAIQSLAPRLAEFGIDANQFIGKATDEALSQVIAETQAFIGSGDAKSFTLGQGQQRFDAQGNVIAAVDPKAVSFQLKPGEQRFENGVVVATGAPLPTVTTPPSLLKGLPPELAAKADAAFVTAGGGKDGVKALNEARSTFDAERKETIKINTKRIGELEQTSKGRNAEIVKARKFLRAFQSGSAQSGAARSGLGFVPGVFTSQGQFDQELDSFAETAARAKLKALGEVRPTDADVQGMKRSLFGVGADEVTNIQLLSDFINEQEALDDELDGLRNAKAAGTLDSFVGGGQGQQTKPLNIGRFQIEVVQ